MLQKGEHGTFLGVATFYLHPRRHFFFSICLHGIAAVVEAWLDWGISMRKGL